MPQTQALGDGPIIITSDDARQIFVPLSAVFFNNGLVGTTRPVDAATPRLLRWWRRVPKRAGMEDPVPRLRSFRRWPNT